MPEITIKYKGSKALKAIKELAEMFDMVIEGPLPSNKPANDKPAKDLPITFAKHPDVTALAGIWKGRDITLAQLRKEAWGERL
jgi:hypothetical protein